MPAVIALRRQEDGEISFIVGEDADSLPDDPDNPDAPLLVVRNIKRLAMSTDTYVNWHLEVRNAHEQTAQWPPQWWNAEKRCVQRWGKEFPVWELIGHILSEAFSRTSINGEFEWRAGCPVHANFEYRAGLSQTLSQLTGKGKLNWIIEEPILFLTLARRLGNLEEGSYLVYDIGGGSFDCALIEFREGVERRVVYGADGHPLLGGSDIDEQLRKKLGYDGPLDLLRKAKENLTRQNPSVTLGNGTILTLDDVEEVLREGRFIEKTVMTMRDAYIGSKVLWKRSHEEDAPPIGEVIALNGEAGAQRFVWQLMWDDMAEDVDGIFLFGGPTNTAYVFETLSSRFGAHKLMTATDVLPTLTGTPDLELVGLSYGACYSEDSYPPLYLNRLPMRVTLQNLQTGTAVEYEPFQNFASTFNPFSQFISEPLSQEIATTRSQLYPKTFELTITYPDGLISKQEFVDKYINSSLKAYTLRLVIDRYGRIGVEQESAISEPKRFLVIEEAPWQTEEQRQALQRLLEQQRQYEATQRQQARATVNRLPWQYPTP